MAGRGNKFGWHSGTLTCKDLTVLDDITFSGGVKYGNFIAGDFIVQGRISTKTVAGASLNVDASTYAYGEGMEMRYAVTDWADVYTITAFKGMYLRAEAVEGNASGSVRAAEFYGVCNITTGTTGLSDLRSAYFEMLVKADDANKTITNGGGIEANISVENQTGVLTFTNNIYCVYAKAQTGTGIADYTKINGIKVAGRDDGTVRVFGIALDISDPEATVCTWTTAISVSTAAATGFSLSAATTTGISVTGSATDGLKFATGTFTDAIEIAGTVTNGLNITGTVTKGINIANTCVMAFDADINAGTVTGEVHGMELDYTGTLSSGDSLVGLNVATTTAGTAGTWVSGIYAKVIQGATKNVNGYLCAAEFETINSANNVSDNFVLVLNSNNSGGQRGQHESYIALRSYGSLAANSFLWIEDQTIGADNDTTSLVAANNPTAATHTLRIIIDDTAYYIMLCNAASLAS